MWDKVAAAVRAYSSVVVTGLDETGYPYSVRCAPRLLDGEQMIDLDLPVDTDIRPGQASVMGHKHDQDVWSLTSFLVRGTLERKGERWLFRPAQFTPGAPASPVDMVRFLFASRQTAANYLQRRNLPRPAVNWHEVKALWKEAEAVRKKSS